MKHVEEKDEPGLCDELQHETAVVVVLRAMRGWFIVVTVMRGGLISI